MGATIPVTPEASRDQRTQLFRGACVKATHFVAALENGCRTPLPQAPAQSRQGPAETEQTMWLLIDDVRDLNADAIARTPEAGSACWPVALGLPVPGP